MTLLQFSAFEINDAQDIEVMIDCHLQFKEMISYMDVYAKIDTAEEYESFIG